MLNKSLQFATKHVRISEPDWEMDPKWRSWPCNLRLFSLDNRHGFDVKITHQWTGASSFRRGGLF